MIVLSIGAVSADDADDAIASTNDDTVLEDSEATASGTVSGGVDVVTENPWGTQGQPNHGELSYDIPADAKTIKSADVYVNIYGASATDAYATNVTTTIKTNNDDESYNEILCIASEKSSTVFPVNDHVTKSYLDYMIHYNITSKLTGLNGTTLKINVDTNNMTGLTGKSFDGRIKLIALVLAYDDGDDDIINYWINDNQIWTGSNTTLTFDTTAMSDVLEMSLTNIALDSSDATYFLNGNLLTDSEYKSGSYYRYNKWDVTEYYNSSKKTEFLGIGAQGSYGVSHKQALAVLVAKPGQVASSIDSIATERLGKVYSDTQIPIAYPGLSNKITIKVTTNKNGKYIVKLFADSVEVNSTEISLKAGTTQVTLIDNTIRPVNSSATYTGRTGTYDKVNYTAQLFLKDEKLANSSIDAVILYNGYFNKALYDQNSLESFYNGTITGDIVIDVSDFVNSAGTSGKYASGTTNRVDNWTVSLKDGSIIVKAFIYVPYTSITGDNINMLNATFNNQTLTPVAFIRDQTNAVGLGGYGVLVYDVTSFIINGNNTLTLNRTLSGGIYPSTLIYLTNDTGSNVIKEVYISNCADVLGAYGNGDRKLKIDSTFDVSSSEAVNATVYVFGAGSEPGRASISVNGVLDDNVWNTTVKNTVSYYTKDLTGITGAIDISLILNKGMFTALQQIVVVTKNAPVKPTPKPTPSPAVVKKATKITAKKKTFKAKTKVKKYTITLKSGKSPVKKVLVTLKVKGKTYKAKTNAKGKATFKIKNLKKKGKYTAAIKFKGDKNYKPATKKVKLTVKK